MINKEITSFIKESNDIEGYVYPIEDYNALKATNNHVFNQLVCAQKILDIVENKARFLNSGWLCQFHETMMNGFPNSENIKIGQYRDCNVRVGGRSCPDYKEVPELMEKFIIDYNSMEYDPLEMHYRFELIHPFQDGNGRIGRLLYLYDLLRRGLPVKNILDNYEGDNFIEKRYKYYRAIDNFNNKNT